MIIDREVTLADVGSLRLRDEFPSRCCDHGVYVVEVLLADGRALTHCSDCGREWTLTVVGTVRDVLEVMRHVTNDET